MRPDDAAGGPTGVLVAAGVLFVDQLTKVMAADGSGSVWRNPDYAFGSVRGSATTLILVAAFVLGGFLFVARLLATRLGISMLLPALVAGGAIGNTLDRLRLGSVRDFLVTPWAIINVADIAVAVGVIGIAIALAVRVPRLRLASAATSR